MYGTPILIVEAFTEIDTAPVPLSDDVCGTENLKLCPPADEAMVIAPPPSRKFAVPLVYVVCELATTSAAAAAVPPES